MNGMSAMQSDVTVHNVEFRSGVVMKTTDVGTWSVGEPDNFRLASGQSFAGVAATTVYKVVTVVVSRIDI